MDRFGFPRLKVCTATSLLRCGRPRQGSADPSAPLPLVHASTWTRLALPPSRPAAAARSRSCAKLPPLAFPPLLAISRCRCGSMAAKPRFAIVATTSLPGCPIGGPGSPSSSYINLAFIVLTWVNRDWFLPRQMLAWSKQAIVSTQLIDVADDGARAAPSGWRGKIGSAELTRTGEPLNSLRP